MIINELGRCSTRSDVYFAYNKQALFAVFTVKFCFAHAKHNLIKLKLLKFTLPWRLVNQSTLNKAHVIEINKVCTVAFMKVRNFLVVRCRESGKKKMVKMYFLKLLLVDFHRRDVYGSTKLFMADLLSNRLHNDMLLKVDKMYSL